MSQCVALPPSVTSAGRNFDFVFSVCNHAELKLYFEKMPKKNGPTFPNRPSYGRPLREPIIWQTVPLYATCHNSVLATLANSIIQLVELFTKKLIKYS